MGVSVSLIKPYKQSFDFEFCRFWTSSNEWMVETSIIIEPSDGSYLIRSEWYEKTMPIPRSMYFRAYRGQSSIIASQDTTHRCNAADGVVVACHRDFDGLDVFLEC